MIQAVFLSLAQLLDPRIARVFLKSLGVTLLVFAAAGVALWVAMHEVGAMFGKWLGMPAQGSGFADVATLVLVLLAGWLLFRAVAVAVVGFFADDVVAAVEARHYPRAHATARALPFGRALRMGLGSAGRTIGVNLLLSPLYLTLLVTGVGTALLFFLVNAWLLGSDLGEMVAARHLPATALPEWRRRTRVQRFALGSLGTGLFLVPVVNLVAPVLGAAMATHVFHRRRSA